MQSLLLNKITAAATAEPSFIIKSARIRAATLVVVPAFEEAYIELAGEEDKDGLIPWQGVLAMEDTATGDGRVLASGSLRWDTLPIDLAWVRRGEGGHFGQETVGRIDSIERDGRFIRGSGFISTATPEGRMIAELVRHRMGDGISIDLDDIPADGFEIVEPELPEEQTDPESDDDYSALEVVASVVGDTSLAVWDDRDREWNGSAASSRVLDWATNNSGAVNSSRLSQAFLYRNEDANPEAVTSYKLGFVDIVNGRPYIIPRGVFATAGGRGVDAADIPSDQKDAIRSRINTLYEKVANKLDDDDIVPPWVRENSSLTDEELGFTPDPAFTEVQASAWAEFEKIDLYPSEWFAEPTREDLPLGKGGVFSRDGRIWGWVAQKNVIHDKYRHEQLTLQDLNPLDTTAFLRSEVKLDNGETTRVGVITMNAGHHRDGAVCETEVCQFDDTRTVAGIVTVGMNKNGLWFSGSAAPWISDWDRQVFSACQPSLHVVWEKGVYSLRAVLTVPSPGFPSRLVASAVVDRANIALLSNPAEESQGEMMAGELMAFDIDYDKLALKVVEAMDRREQFKIEAAALQAELDETFKEIMEDMKQEVNGGI